jgi:hypothetical protein
MVHTGLFTLINQGTNIDLNEGDEVKVTMSGLTGKYYLFNDYRKYIIIQLLVNAEGYGGDSTDGDEVFSEPKSYLTTVDGYYGYTDNDYYITTQGYVIERPSDTSIDTGSAEDYVASNQYLYTPLKLQNFIGVTSYLNFNYASPNFKVYKNIIPRLKEVTFK